MDRPRHKQPASTALERLGRGHEQFFDCLRQFHRCPSKISYLGTVYHFWDDLVFGGPLSDNLCAFTEATWTIAATARTTLSELESFTKQCGPSDLLVVHFSGHAYHSRGHLYLLCNETDTGRLVSSALDIQSLKDILQGCRASHKLLILDCCHAGAALPDGFKGSPEITSALQEALQGSGSAILAACSARELEILDGGAGFLSWALASACTTRFKEVSLDGRSLSLTQAWQRRILPRHKEVNQKLSKDERLPPPLSWHRQEGDGEIWLTEAGRDTAEKRRHEKPSYDREHFLKAPLADHSSFMHDRLSSFVGRAKELAEIRQRITEKQQTGGYVTITGQAGQGKSSIIAKLVEEYRPENVAYHFIPFNPGPDHQVGLLRNLMARLILKYDLSDLYVASDSRPALHDYFPKVLGELAAKGGQEVIFLDGLDQLEAELSGERDLSFLPNNPPSGVVFVLGTRPNDTLRPLELLKPRSEYQLPDLSREDFDLILRHRHVPLERGLADQFYEAMQGNALFLDLMAKELAERGTPSREALIQQLAHNPEHLFTLTMARLKRQPSEWREVIKPVLGVLLVAREPLGVRHIRQILGIEDDRLREGMQRLGGLLTRDWQQRYSLFHLKLYDYLRQDEQQPNKEYIFATDEEEGWHKRLAQWCEGSNVSIIWQEVKHDGVEQRRREYARQHYLTHLYHARGWQCLFEVLDTAQYGKAKIRDDPSTRS